MVEASALQMRFERGLQSINACQAILLVALFATPL